LDRLCRFERLIEFPKQFFLFVVRNCFISAYLFELFLDGRPWVGENFRLWIDRCRHQGNIGGNRLIFGKILEPMLLGDRVKLRFVLGVGVARKYRALHLFR
jgi:hypothetical protein